jgi:DNA polymerase-3 subunit delta
MSPEIDKAIQAIKQGKYSPIYFLQGDEPYYIDLISNLIEKECLPEHEKGMNQTILYGMDTNTSSVIQRARQFPMMAERALIVVKEAQNLDLEKESGIKIFEKYLENPMPSTVLVICYKNKKLDGRKGIAKQIPKVGVLLNSEKTKDYHLTDWISKYLASNKIKVKNQVPQLLAESIGNDLSRIVTELDKLRINVSPDTIVDEAIIEKYIGISKDFNVFELQNALLQKNAYKAFYIAKHFEMNEKKHPLVLTITSLFSYFQKIVLTHLNSNSSPEALGKLLGIHPFITKEYFTAIKVYNLSKCFLIIQAIREADLRSKGIGAGEMGDGEILRELIIKILS